MSNKAYNVDLAKEINEKAILVDVECQPFFFISHFLLHFIFIFSFTRPHLVVTPFTRFQLFVTPFIFKLNPLDLMQNKGTTCN